MQKVRPPKGIASYSLRVVSEPTDIRTMRGLRLSRESARPCGERFYCYPGTVSNPKSRRAEVNVYVAQYDDRGRMHDVSQDYVEVPPGESARWSARFYERSPNRTRVSYYAS